MFESLLGRAGTTVPEMNIVKLKVYKSRFVFENSWLFLYLRKADKLLRFFPLPALDVPVWSKLESGHLPSMQQLVQILDNEMKLNVHMEQIPHHRS